MKFASCILGVFSVSALMAAPLKFDRVFGSNMVLPHGKKLIISGVGNPGEKVNVTFGEQSVIGTTQKNEHWTVEFPAFSPDKEGKKLSVTQKDQVVTLDNILIGTVWLASGQSNMLFKLTESARAKEDIPMANNTQLRILNCVPQVHTAGKAYTEDDLANLLPDKFYQGEWRVATPESTPMLSAVAYYFADTLQKQLDMPVGIINSSLGGAGMVSWLPPSFLKSNEAYRTATSNNWLDSPLCSDFIRQRAKQNISKFMVNAEEPKHPYKPGFLFTSGIEWIKPLALNGVIWYQGESDAQTNDSKQNTMLLKDLISNWRLYFGEPRLPFIMVQLPRINDKTPIRAYWPEFRAVQEQMTHILKDVYMINTIDLGSQNSNVHPPEKKEIGIRLANAALARVYEKKDIPYLEPKFHLLKITGNEILVKLANDQGLTTSDGAPPTEFEIADSTGHFFPATAEIAPQGHIVLSSAEVKSPKQARYCWAPFVSPNLINKDKLPALPFTTVKEK